MKIAAVLFLTGRSCSLSPTNSALPKDLPLTGREIFFLPISQTIKYGNMELTENYLCS
jgi:hypothetical protein